MSGEFSGALLYRSTLDHMSVKSSDWLPPGESSSWGSWHRQQVLKEYFTQKWPFVDQLFKNSWWIRVCVQQQPNISRHPLRIFQYNNKVSFIQASAQYFSDRQPGLSHIFMDKISKRFKDFSDISESNSIQTHFQSAGKHEGETERGEQICNGVSFSCYDNHSRN